MIVVKWDRGPRGGERMRKGSEEVRGMFPAGPGSFWESPAEWLPTPWFLRAEKLGDANKFRIAGESVILTYQSRSLALNKILVSSTKVETAMSTEEMTREDYHVQEYKCFSKISDYKILLHKNHMGYICTFRELTIVSFGYSLKFWGRHWISY